MARNVSSSCSIGRCCARAPTKYAATIFRTTPRPSSSRRKAVRIPVPPLPANRRWARACAACSSRSPRTRRRARTERRPLRRQSPIRRRSGRLSVLARLLVLGLRLEHATHARAQRRFAGSGGTGIRTAFRLEELGLGVVRNIVAAYFVGALAQQRPIEQLEETFLAIVFGALRYAFVVLVDVVPFLAERDRVAVRGCRYRVVGVLVKDDLVGMDRQRALSQDHVPQQRPDLGLIVHIAGVGLIVDRLVAIRLFRPCIRRLRHEDGDGQNGGDDGRADAGKRVRHREMLCGCNCPLKCDLNLTVLVLLSSSRPFARIIPRGSVIVTGRSVTMRSSFGITCRKPLVTVIGPSGLPAGAPGAASRTALTLPSKYACSRSPVIVARFAVTSSRGLPGSVNMICGASNAVVSSSGKCCARLAMSACRTRPSLSRFTALKFSTNTSGSCRPDPSKVGPAIRTCALSQ